MMRPDGDPAEIVGGDRSCSEWWWSEPAVSVERLQRRQRRGVRMGATAVREIDDALQQIDEQALEGQI